MSDSARHAAFIVPEAVYGITIDNPVFQTLRHVSMTLGVSRSSLQSAELRADRQIADFRLGTHSVAGEIGGELSFGSYDNLLEGALMASFAIKSELSGITFSAAAADDSFSDSANGFIAAGLEVGDLISVEGFTTIGNNGSFKIATIAAGKITVTNPDGTAAATIANEVAGDAVDITSHESVLKAGTTRKSFSMLRHFTDIAAAGEGKPYHLFKGVEINTLALAVSPAAIVTATFGVLGKEGVAPSNTAPAGSTYVDPTTTAPLDAFTGAMLKDGIAVGNITEISLSLTNGLEPRNVVGSKFTILPAAGQSNLTGSVGVYFDDASFINDFSAETEVSLEFELPDGDGNSYIFEIPRLKFTAGQPDVSGAGSIVLNMPFQALFDPTTGTNIIIRKKPFEA
jgi:hypothetical protein